MDERIASLPEVLETLDGEKVTSAEQWQQKRRPEIFKCFREHVFGREPCPDRLSFHMISEEQLKETIKSKKVRLTYVGPGGEGTFNVHLLIPCQSRQPVPAFLLINHQTPESPLSTSFWPTDEIVSRGYAAIVIHVQEIDPDFDDGFKNGVHALFDAPGEPRPKNAWGTLAAWAWGASRVMDYLETDPDIDQHRVAVVGHSRGGKTALWAGAVDQRFKMVVSNNSGCTGAALSRGKKGETIKAINTRFPHWFAENYKAFNDKEYDMPFDQHMLLSLIAPRLLYVTSATEDDWSDPESEFLSLLLTSPVYQLFGLKGLGESPYPSPEEPIIGEHVGYHLRTGQHDLVEYDWKCFLDFADRFL
ncbi:hypothetical protein JOD43_002284 [Pullulanibacillus pueri]|uniref:Acetylxylan esterase n=1 Tax=Pullulanibacillus pueri TaxID=1437324 RepID=A0A8J3ELU1_9BACL|nr:prolyl oligopeptidase family serine peptidase [Pullulanibacillus pueri]MBM7682111.1 hypothetical protein [Pullulanibacillus pueri]GGH79937.1 acetylxylan esterase [Pullulanibacillus pueri]